MNSRNTPGLPSQLQRRGPGLVGGYAPEAALSSHQTKPEAIWTLSGRKNALTSGLPVNIAEQLEDTQCVSCFTSLALRRNDDSWTKLLLTTPGPDRQRGRTRDRTDTFPLVYRTNKEVAVSHQMEGIPGE